MLAICIRLAAAIHGYLAFYMPTNRAVDWLRSPSGFMWAFPVAILATPTYLFAMSVCMSLIARGGPGYLNVLVMLFAWNAMKFALLGLLSPLMPRRGRVASRRSCSARPTTAFGPRDLPRLFRSAAKPRLLGETSPPGLRTRLQAPLAERTSARVL